MTPVILYNYTCFACKGGFPCLFVYNVKILFMVLKYLPMITACYNFEKIKNK